MDLFLLFHEVPLRLDVVYFHYSMLCDVQGLDNSEVLSLFALISQRLQVWIPAHGCDSF